MQVTEKFTIEKPPIIGDKYGFSTLEVCEGFYISNPKNKQHVSALCHYYSRKKTSLLGRDFKCKDVGEGRYLVWRIK